MSDLVVAEMGDLDAVLIVGDEQMIEKVVVALFVVLTVMVDFRVGGYVLAAALALAAVMRATLPEKYCLGLLVRSCRVDVAIDTALAVAVFVGAVFVGAQIATR